MRFGNPPLAPYGEQNGQRSPGEQGTGQGAAVENTAGQDNDSSRGLSRPEVPQTLAYRPNPAPHLCSKIVCPGCSHIYLLILCL